MQEQISAFGGNVTDTSQIKNQSGLRKYITQEKLGEVDSRQWKGDWGDRWVVFADLIGFADRSIRSQDVVLNNILRFDRASNIVISAFPKVRTFRFSDSTFGIAEDFHTALAFAMALHHCCHAINLEYIKRTQKKLFIHLIIPRIVLDRGAVLTIPTPPPASIRFHGLDPKSVIAGAGIVNAHRLEKNSAAGLLSFNRKHLSELTGVKIRGGPSSIQRIVERWLKSFSKKTEPKNGNLLARGDMIDFPWILFRPLQMVSGQLWASESKEVNQDIIDFLKLWELGLQEFFSPQGAKNSLEVPKHYIAPLRHGVQCAQMRLGQVSPNYFSIEEIMDKLK